MAQKFSLEVDIQGDFKNFQRSLTSVQKSVKRFGSSVEGVGRSLTSAFISLGGGVFFGKIIKDASDAEETLNKFAVVFKDVAEDASAAANNLANNFGVSNTAARELLANTGDLLIGFGFTGEKALELSENVQQLASDLASFTNLEGGAQRASEAITKALLGETESLKSLNVTLRQTDVQKRIQKLASEGVTFATEREAKAQATYQLIVEQSTNSIGDFARSQSSFANQSKIARASLENLSESLGNLLLPFATRVISAINSLISSFVNLSKEGKVLILASVALFAALGPLLIVVGKLIIVFGSLLGVLGFLVSPIALISAGLATVGAAIFALIQRFQAFKNAGVGTFDAIKLVILDVADVINLILVKSFQEFVNLAIRGTNLINSALGREIQPLLDLDGFNSQIDSLRDGILEANGVAIDSIKDPVDAIKDSFSELGKDAIDLKNKFVSLFGGVGSSAAKAGDSAQKAANSTDDLTKKIARPEAQAAASGLADAFGNIADGSKNASEAFSDFAGNFLEQISQMILQSLILSSIQGALPGASTTRTARSATGGLVSGGSISRRFAEGGMVSGPGTGTSDSIPAMLSNGEFVNDARTVGFFGSGFFQNLKRVSRGEFGIPQFRDGGFVSTTQGSEFTQQAQNPSNIVIQNSGEPKSVSNVFTKEDSQGIVTKIVLEDLERNGPINKTLSRKRSGPQR